MTQRSIDLRSDTVTLPTEKMYRSMISSPLGDDVFRDDPTINKLEKECAELFNKEAGLFLVSGTQSNLCAILSQTNPGDEIICEADSHILYYEAGGIARIGGLLHRALKSKRGYLPPDVIQKSIRPTDDLHQPLTTLLCVENTHNRHGGTVLSLQEMEKMYDVAKENNLSVHLDGARVFNAITYLNCDPSEIGKYADTINFCLSKGLSCPVGSILVGSNAVINRARKFRKMLGGGIRQGGVLAGPGLVALNETRHRLIDDHNNAKILGNTLQGFDKVNVSPFETNIVIFDVKELGVSSYKIVEKLEEHGCFGISLSDTKIRLTTNRNVNQEDIQYVSEVLQRILSEF